MGSFLKEEFDTQTQSVGREGGGRKGGEERGRHTDTWVSKSKQSLKGSGSLDNSANSKILKESHSLSERIYKSVLANTGIAALAYFFSQCSLLVSLLFF